LYEDRLKFSLPISSSPSTTRSAFFISSGFPLVPRISGSLPEVLSVFQSFEPFFVFFCPLRFQVAFLYFAFTSHHRLMLPFSNRNINPLLKTLYRALVNFSKSFDFLFVGILLTFYFMTDRPLLRHHPVRVRISLSSRPRVNNIFLYRFISSGVFWLFKCFHRPRLLKSEIAMILPPPFFSPQCRSDASTSHFPSVRQPRKTPHSTLLRSLFTSCLAPSFVGADPFPPCFFLLAPSAVVVRASTNILSSHGPLLCPRPQDFFSTLQTTASV